MDYLLKINNTSKAKSLLQFLKNIDFIEIEKHDTMKEWKAIVKEAENTKSIPLAKAKSMRDTWKKELKSKYKNMLFFN
jgi:uncharacterized protein (UPF0335 family)